VQTLAVLADDTRRRILDLLAEGELAAGAIAGRFPISQPAVSRHLKVLREAGLVSVEVRAQQRVYRLDPAPLRELDDWLAGYRRFWGGRLDALDTEIARGRRARRKDPR
jgi:DNA-binding transcriptional ArsR family regulator